MPTSSIVNRSLKALPSTAKPREWAFLAAGVLLAIAGIAAADPARRLVSPAAYDWQPEVLPAERGQLIDSTLLLVPRGNEMAVIAAIELDRNDRHVRAEVVRWFEERSHTAGLVSDFLIHSSNSGMHLDVQSRDALMLRWDSRF